jgi:hypothetical protein
VVIVRVVKVAAIADREAGASNDVDCRVALSAGRYGCQAN